MIFTVSTVKDTLPNVRRFVEGNLASGADHMFVFLEGDDADVREYLTAQPHVTMVDTEVEEYWAGRRPENLNHRQVMNATLVSCLLTPFPWAQWLAHIDGDECLEVDRDALVGLGPATRAVHLSTLESVSAEEPSDAPWFKRLLDDEDLALLTSLGVISEPDNRRYFAGHAVGKSAIRPALDVTVGLHRARTTSGTGLKLHSGPFHVLHYDSVSFDEFLRKWTTQMRGGAPNVKPKRALVSGAVSAVLRNDHLDESAKERHLRGIYRRHVQDPVETLLELGLLVKPRPELHAYEPTALSREQRRELDAVLDRLRLADKRWFGPAHELPGVLRELDRVASDLRSEHPATAERISTSVRLARAAGTQARPSAQRGPRSEPRGALSRWAARTAELRSRLR